MAGTSISLPFSRHRLRDLRERAGLNQTELSARCKAAGYDISRGQISRYENGENKPTPKTLEGLVVALAVKTDDLLDTESEGEARSA